MTLTNVFARARYRYFPDRQIGELLAKPWIDTAIPISLLVLVVVTFTAIVPGFATAGNLSDTGRQWGEVGFLTLGLAFVVLSGGIDLSVGAIYGLACFATVATLQGLRMPVVVGLMSALVVGAAIGAINGWLVGAMKMRAFLSTLALLIVCRSIQEILALRYGASLLTDPGGLEMWYWFGEGSILGIPVSLAMLLVAGVAAHFCLTRLSIGWRIQAVGGSRRSAYNSGIAVPATVMFCYVFSGLCAGMAGFLYSARTANPGADVGAGFEIIALTAAILGGNSLGGGRGSAAKAIVGALIVVLLVNSLVALGLRSGATNLALGLTLLAAVLVDIRWTKNRGKILESIYVSPAHFDSLRLPSPEDLQKGVFAMNKPLSEADALARGKLHAPQSLAFDRRGNLYTVSTSGDVLVLASPGYAEPEVFAHIGGQPLGIAIDGQDTVHVCVAGMGLYAIGQDRVPHKLCDQVPRTLLSIRDDSRVRFPHALDIAPDGRIFFTEATGRFDIHDWFADSIEMRPNGRLLVYDPRAHRAEVVLRDLIFPGGVCVESSGSSLLISETWACRVSRLWIAGARKGCVERVIENLPGFPMNVNPSSDGHFWLALVAGRTPVHELLVQSPGVRKRMAQRVAYDEWLVPNFNVGGVLKFSATGSVLECLWDQDGQAEMTPSCAREQDGSLYVGAIFSDRILRKVLAAGHPQTREGATDRRPT